MHPKYHWCSILNKRLLIFEENDFFLIFNSFPIIAEAPILWPPDVKSWFIGKDPDAGKDWGQEEKGMTEDEMVGWHQWLDEHEFEQTLGAGEGQGSLVCCSLWGGKESDTTVTEQQFSCLNFLNQLFQSSYLGI